VDRQRTELIEREGPIRMVDDHLLDAVEIRLLVRVARFLPGLRSLKTDLMGVEDLAQPLSRDHDRPVRVLGEPAGQLTRLQ